MTEPGNVVTDAEDVLRNRYGVDRGEAFEMLVRFARYTDRTLDAVARWYVEDADHRTTRN